MTTEERIAGVCRDCGRRMRVVALDRGMNTDPTRIIGGPQGRIRWRDQRDFVLRLVCEANHVWWLALDAGETADLHAVRQ